MKELSYKAIAMMCGYRFQKYGDSYTYFLYGGTPTRLSDWYDTEEIAAEQCCIENKLIDPFDLPPVKEA